MNVSKQITERKIPAAPTKEFEETLHYARLAENYNTDASLYVVKGLIDHSFESGRVSASNRELLFDYIDNKISILQERSGCCGT